MSDAGQPPPPGEPARRPLVPPLVATAWLAVVAGWVDAVSYVHLFGTFPANQSGNAVLLGIAAGEGQLRPAVLALTSLVGFGLGVAVGVAVDDRERRSAPYRPRLALVIELVLLAAVTAAVLAVGGGDEPFTGIAGPLLLLPTAFAMGVQTPVITRTGDVPTPTTYMTGSVTHLAESLAHATARRGRPEARRQARTGALLAGVLGSYVAGAAAGALVSSHWRASLLVPTAALAVLVALRHH